MKRPKEPSTPATSQSPAQPAAKKLKMTPPEPSGGDTAELGGSENGEWTKVEKRKGKKHKKLEVKADVCVLHSSVVSCLTLTSSCVGLGKPAQVSVF